MSGGGGSAYDLSIDGNAATAMSPSVTVSLYGTEAYTMAFSSTLNFASSTWISYATTYPYTFPGVGNQTLYVEFKAINGTVVGSAHASIDIVPVVPSAITTSSAALPFTPQSTSSRLETELQSLETSLALLESSVSQASRSSLRYVRPHKQKAWLEVTLPPSL